MSNIKKEKHPSILETVHETVKGLYKVKPGSVKEFFSKATEIMRTADEGKLINKNIIIEHTVKSEFYRLVGIQKNIIILICNELKKSRSRITESLTLEHIANTLKCSTGAVKTSIQRLEKKECLIRVEFKNGRGGWSRYEVPDHIYYDFLKNEN